MGSNPEFCLPVRKRDEDILIEREEYEASEKTSRQDRKTDFLFQRQFQKEKSLLTWSLCPFSRMARLVFRKQFNTAFTAVTVFLARERHLASEESQVQMGSTFSKSALDAPAI